MEGIHPAWYRVPSTTWATDTEDNTWKEQRTVLLGHLGMRGWLGFKSQCIRLYTGSPLPGDHLVWGGHYTQSSQQPWKARGTVSASQIGKLRLKDEPMTVLT